MLYPIALQFISFFSDSHTKSENDTQTLNNSNYTLNTSNIISNNLNNKVSSQWTTSGLDINYITGNVGIGGINTSYKLNVEGSLKVLDSIASANLYISSRASIGGFNDGTCSLFVNGLIKSDGLNVNGITTSTATYTDEFQLEWGNAFFSVRNSSNPTFQTFQGLPLIINPVGLNRVGIGLTNPRERLESNGNTIVNGAITSATVNTTSINSTSINITDRIDCAFLVASQNIFAGNAMYINTFPVTSIYWFSSSVAEYNGSRQINIPIRGTNAVLYLYFGDIGSHTIFLKTGNSYVRRVGNGGNNWDFCETNRNEVRCWYHWRSVGDRITAITHWWN